MLEKLNDGENVDDNQLKFTKVDNDKDNSSGIKYVNANFIPGYFYQNEYIATSAPWNMDVVDDFYRIILQYRVQKIVNLVEYGEH